MTIEEVNAFAEETRVRVNLLSPEEKQKCLKVAMQIAYPPQLDKAATIHLIMENFDFEKVQKFMRKKRWKWNFHPEKHCVPKSSEFMRVPTIAELKNATRELMEGNWPEAPYSTNCGIGGFAWEIKDPWCKLEFYSTEFPSGKDNEKILMTIKLKSSVVVASFEVGKPHIRPVCGGKGRRTYGIFIGSTCYVSPSMTKKQAEAVCEWLAHNWRKIGNIGWF